MDNVTLFQGCGEKMLDSISVLLREVQVFCVKYETSELSNWILLQFAPEEYLFRAGETAHEMFFVVSGSVEEVSETDEVSASEAHQGNMYD